MRSNTSFEVRPDKHSAEEISRLRPEIGVIVYDTTARKNKYYDGSEWVEMGGDSDELFIIERDEDGNIIKIISRYDLQVPAESIEVGESIKISDLGQVPSFTTKFDDKRYLMMGYEVGEVPQIKELGEESSFELQAFDDETLVFNTPVEFTITSQQDVIGQSYNPKIFSKEDVRFRVFRVAENGGEDSKLVDEILPQETLSLNGTIFNLTPMVDFAANKVYRLVFTSDSGVITVRGTELEIGGQYGVSRATNTVFFPYIKREKGLVYTEKNLTHLDYENKRVDLEPVDNQYNRLTVLREYHKKRIIVSDGSKKIEAALPNLTVEDDGWTCQIVNLTPKMIAVGGYKFKNGGSNSSVFRRRGQVYTLSL